MSSQRGFAGESLGEPPNFQVVASGSQQYLNMEALLPNCLLLAKSIFLLSFGSSYQHHHTLMRNNNFGKKPFMSVQLQVFIIFNASCC